MYPRNAASPERVAIGAVILIADGTVQTLGVTVRVRGQGGAEADGGGTTVYSTDGIVEYTPTQAETNFTSFILIAKKTACIPAAVTVVTSAASTAGQAALETATQASIDAIETDTNSLNNTKVPQTLNLTASGNIGIDWANVENPTTALDLSGTDIQLCDTITTYTGNTVQTGDTYALANGSAGFVAIDTVVDAIKVVTDAQAADGSGLTALPNVTLANGAHGGPLATLVLSDYSDYTGAAASSPQLMQSTTIATLTTQTEFTLTAGSADNDAYNNATIVITDASTSTQKAVGYVNDDTGSTKTISLDEDPGVFTMAAGDTVEILAESTRLKKLVATGSGLVGWLG